MRCFLQYNNVKNNRQSKRQIKLVFKEDILPPGKTRFIVWGARQGGSRGLGSVLVGGEGAGAPVRVGSGVLLRRGDPQGGKLLLLHWEACGYRIHVQGAHRIQEWGRDRRKNPDDHKQHL